MRVIKFRIWDKVHKKMLWTMTLIELCSSDIFIDYGQRNIEIMQFTGLLDKNGKEIFEGDIVEWDNGRICEIYWHSSVAHNGWDLKALNTKGRPNEKYKLWEGLTVIGNIYENPKLLKTNK